MAEDTEATTPILILDGGLGTSLEDKYGVNFSSSATPLWSSHLLVSDPTTLLRCQKDFGACSVDVIETATYQVSIEGFAKTITASHPNEIDCNDIPGFLADAVRIANEARQKPGSRVALSLGPYGACMTPSQEYSGEYDGEHQGEQALRSWHLARLSLFAEVDGLFDSVQFVAFETLPRLDEIYAVRKLFNNSPGEAGNPRPFLNRLGQVPFWISCLFPGEGGTIPDGSTVDQVVEAMLSNETAEVVPWGIGINCTKIDKLSALIEGYETAVANLIKEAKLKAWPSLVLYPDGTNGEVYNTDTQRWELPQGRRKPTTSWEDKLAAVVTAAASRRRWRTILVGGCCKTSDSDIRNLIRAIDSRKRLP